VRALRGGCCSGVLPIDLLLVISAISAVARHFAAPPSTRVMKRLIATAPRDAAEGQRLICLGRVFARTPSGLSEEYGLLGLIACSSGKVLRPSSGSRSERSKKPAKSGGSQKSGGLGEKGQVYLNTNSSKKIYKPVMTK
jgi:hypothetical protein